MGTWYGDAINRRWALLVLLMWIIASALFIHARWNGIQWFSLGDTDDNLRMSQVRALLAGQGWYDLRQYKLNPPFGADIHWSRLVDLPIAGLKLALSPLFGGRLAEKAAVTLAPLLPMLVAFYAMGATCRRLIAPLAFALGIAFLLSGTSIRGMWMPLRIDHHGWQLALLSLVVLGLSDSRPMRGGLVLGLATAASLTIGLEMLLYLALAGAVTGLRWVRGGGEAPRLISYGVSLAGGSALGFLVFASNANRAPVCDAFSPVWLSMMSLAGGLAVLIALVSPAKARGRIGAAALTGSALAIAYVLLWPDCVGRLERSSPELQDLWLSHVREARPIYMHSLNTMVAALGLPLAGLVGYGAMLWRHRNDEKAWIAWASIGALALLALGLLLWQTRAVPAAQLLSVPGVSGLAWVLICWFQARRSMPVRVGGTIAAFLVLSGIAGQVIAQEFPALKSKSRGNPAVNAANARCPTLPALRPVALQPAGTVLTHVDLGPRLITVTPHKAIAGPYHRNQEDILAVMRAFRGSAQAAHRTVIERKIDYVLICPNLSEATIYRANAPKGFYVQLATGQVPAWLEPVRLPEASPYRMWRVKR